MAHTVKAGSYLLLICGGLIPLVVLAQDEIPAQALSAAEVTSSGRWRAAAPANLSEMYTLQSFSQRAAPFATAASNVADTTLFEGARSYTLAPVVTSPQDLSLLLTGRNVGPDQLSERMARFMQVVPGVPPRFSDPKFNEARAAFAACAQAAQAYRALSLHLATSTQFALDLRSETTTTNVGAYERDCLTALDAVPVAVRGVTGVLVTPAGAPWCSATIIGSDRLLTARHCFVDAVTGTPYDTFHQVPPGRIGFRSIEPHNGRHSFSTRWLRAPPLEKFGPLDDFVVLKIKDWTFERWAATATKAPTNAEMPIAAWVVGSNATLGDVAKARTPFEFTRGSSPEACSLLEVTANGCLYHSCQTGEATSGAGVLTLSESGSVTLLGVHNAAIAGAQGCEATPPVEDTINLAIDVASKDLE